MKTKHELRDFIINGVEVTTKTQRVFRCRKTLKPKKRKAPAYLILLLSPFYRHETSIMTTSHAIDTHICTIVIYIELPNAFMHQFIKEIFINLVLSSKKPRSFVETKRTCYNHNTSNYESSHN